MLPRVKIFFENGNLNLAVPSPDGLLGLVATGTAVAGTFVLSTPYLLRSLESLVPLGVTEANNPSVYKLVREFYEQAGNGTEVYIMAVPDTMKHSDVVDITNASGAKKLVDVTAGKLRGIVVSRTPGVGYTPTITDGMDADIALAITKGQAFAEDYTNNKFAPLFILLEGYAFSGTVADLPDLTNGTSNNRVMVMLGDTVVSSKNAALGVLAGRIASIPVQRNIGRVKDGPLKPLKTYLGATLAELADVATIHSKGFITFRAFVGQTGYYFNDDFMATKPTDDYSHLTHRRTIDKAYRIAYTTILQLILDEVPVNADGTLPTAIVKGWQADVETAISSQMTAVGELSGNVADGDKGVVCFIDATQNLISTSKLEISIRVRPFGYPRMIDVYLGFQLEA